jgi:predicted O-methyltransferase YrrM
VYKELKKGMRGKFNDPLNRLAKLLPENTVMAEIGPYAGEGTLIFLQSGRIKKIYSIDPWSTEFHEDPMVRPEDNDRDRYVFNNMDWAEWSFDQRVKGFDQVVKMKMTSEEAFKNLPKGLDFIYIDGDHRYESVLFNIAQAKKHVKKGGWIGGNAYILYPSITKAVKENFEDIIEFGGHNWMVKV